MRVQIALSPEDYAVAMLKRLWRTKSVRFESSRRLVKRDAVSRLSVAMLSVYVICIVVIDLVYHKRLESTYPLLIPLATVVAPIFILVIEAHEGGKHYRVTAERMHRSAQRIQVLHAKLEDLVSRSNISSDAVGAISTEYQQILCDFSEHHENVDYFYVQALNPFDFEPESRARRLRLKIRGIVLRWVDIWALPTFLILVPGTFIISVIVILVRST
jgi:hypothetical protein